MSKQQNYFYDSGEVFLEELNLVTDGQPDNLTGNTFTLVTSDQTVAGTVVGNRVTFTAVIDETTNYIMGRVYADGTYEEMLHGVIKVTDWLEGDCA